MILRSAAPGDDAAIANLYAHHVLEGFGTFEEVPPSAEDMASRLSDVAARGLPWLVACDDDGALHGYAYAAPFRFRSAYRFTLEDSIYVAPAAQRRGVGRALLARLIADCQAWGCRELLAVIGDSDNAASIALHQSLGFKPAGMLQRVGYKRERWLDVALMQLALAASGPTDRIT